MTDRFRECRGCGEYFNADTRSKRRFCDECRADNILAIHRKANQVYKSVKPYGSYDSSCGIPGSYHSEGHISLEQYDQVTRDALMRVLN